jgi:nicotinamide-nucleotide amidase
MTPGGVPASDPLVAATRAHELVEALTVRGETVATAETLTARLLAGTIAGVPGASAVLRGGLVVHAAVRAVRHPSRSRR